MNKQDQLKQSIAYYEGDKIANLKKSIEYYKSIGARKNLTEMYADLEDLERTVKNMKDLLENGPQKRTGLKVKVTTFNGKLVVETMDIDDFDEDFVPNGQGRIGCSLTNNARLGISTEALELMKTFKKVGDVIGDLMGEDDSFSWIGGPIRVMDGDSVVCRYFKMPEGYVVIENTTTQGLTDSIEEKTAGAVSIEYEDFEQELWIELSKTGSWKPKADNPEQMEHVYNDYFTLQNQEGARFVGGRVYDPEVRIMNAPEGMIKNTSDGHRTVLMDKAIEKEILQACIDIFKTGDERFSWDIKVPDSEVMSYINPLFDLGFDNNVMNPGPGFWRMSIKATPKQILEKLRSFKREVISAEV